MPVKESMYRDDDEEVRAKEMMKSVFLTRPLNAVKYRHVVKLDTSLRDIDMHDIGVGGSPTNFIESSPTHSLGSPISPKVKGIPLSPSKMGEIFKIA